MSQHYADIKKLRYNKWKLQPNTPHEHKYENSKQKDILPEGRQQKQEELQPCSLWKEDHIHGKIDKIKRQKTFYQMKEQDKDSEKQLSELEIGNLPEKEFRIMIVKMIQDLRKRMEAKTKKMEEMFDKDLEELKKKHLEELKNKQTEVNNTITEMKNTLEGIDSRITEAEKRISDLEDRMVEFTAVEQNKEKRMGDFPGGAVVKNPPANAGDMGSCPGPGRSHMPWSN